MIRVENMPVVNIYNIKEELMKRGVESRYLNKVRRLMFDDRFMNDVYASYYIGDDVCEEYYDDEGEAKVVQMIIDILREACPDSDAVLVDVSW